MTKRLRSVLTVVALLACSLMPLTAMADVITFAEAFIASGTVNGNPFSLSQVIFSLTTDTTLITGSGGVFLTPDGPASIFIEGVGTGTLNDPFYVFDNQNVSVAGFTDVNIGDAVELSNSAFATYDLKSPIGPLISTFFFVGTGQAFGSQLGTIIIDSASDEQPPLFVAAFGGPAPEPNSLILFGSGVAGLAAMIRRKLRA